MPEARRKAMASLEWKRKVLVPLSDEGDAPEGSGTPLRKEDQRVKVMGGGWDNNYHCQVGPWSRAGNGLTK